MKLQFLGTAAAEGVPSLFCQCEVCRKARERGGREIRSRSQAIVNDRLMIDFPCDTFSHVTQHGIDLSRVRNFLITHVHGDHTFPWELCNIRRGRAHFREDGIDGVHFYGSEDVAPRFEAQIKEVVDRIHVHTVAPFAPFTVENMKITALKAKHGTAHPYIYMIEDGNSAMLYGHDTDVFCEETWEYLKGASVVFDLVSLDCTGGAHEDLNYSGHMCLGRNITCRNRMMECGIANGDTVFVLNHFSHNGLNVNYLEFSQLAQQNGFEISYDGMTVEV